MPSDCPLPSRCGSKLTDALPVDMEVSIKLVLQGALYGLLDEAVVLAVLRSTQPMALKREPNKQNEYEELIAHYGPSHAELDTFSEDEVLANLAAYLSFQRMQCDPRRLRRARRAAAADDERSELEGEGVWLCGLKNRPELNGQRVSVGRFDAARGRYAVKLSDGEELMVRRSNLAEQEAEWCRRHQISHTAVLAVTRVVDHIMGTLYHIMPPILCHHLQLRHAQKDPAKQIPAPSTVPAPSMVSAPTMVPAERQIFSTLVSKRSERLLRKLLQTLRPSHDRLVQAAPNESAPCFFFQRGCCSVSACPYLHRNSSDMRPICQFALKGTCKFGARCKNRHAVVAPAIAEQSLEVAQLQADVQKGLRSRMEMFARVDVVGAISDGHMRNCMPPVDYLSFASVVLLGEGDFAFGAALASLASSATPPQPAAANGAGGRRLQPSSILATTVQTEEEVASSHPQCAPTSIAQLRESGAAVCFGVDARHLDEHLLDQPPPGCLLWNMPFAADIKRGQSVRSEVNARLMRGFFSSILRCAESWRRSHPTWPLPRVFFTVGINQFADWGLLAVANETFLTLEVSQTSYLLTCLLTYLLTHLLTYLLPHTGGGPCFQATAGRVRQAPQRA